MTSSEVTSRPFYTGYRSTFTFRTAQGEDPADVIEAYVRAWLKLLTQAKGELADWDGILDLHLPEGIIVQEARYQPGTESFGGRLYRVYLPELTALQDAGSPRGQGAPGRVGRESGGDARYHRSSIYVFPTEHRGHPAASVLVQGATDDPLISEAIDEYEVPSVIPQILRTRTVYDGNTRLTAEPKALPKSKVRLAAEAVLDPERHTPVIIAVSPGREHDETFGELLRELTARMTGAATVFLVPAEAVQRMNDQLPSHLQVRPGTGRMFMPNVDPDDPQTEFVHRYIGPSQLLHSLARDRDKRGSLPTLYARWPRRTMLQDPLPERLAHLRAQVEKQARSNRLAAAVRKKFVQRQRESAEQGLGGLGQASFDRSFLGGFDEVADAPLAPESVDELKEFLAPTEPERPAPSPSPSSPASSKQAAAKHEPSQPDDQEPATSTPSDGAADRPDLDNASTGVKRVLSFVRRWLYPHRHKDVSEVTLDHKIVEVDRVFVAKDDEREAALALVDEAHDEQARLVGALHEVRRELADSKADAALLQLEIREHSAKSAFYRKELAAAKRFDLLNREIDDEDEDHWQVPGDLHEIASILALDADGSDLENDMAARVRQYVVFTGDLGAVDQVAARDAHGNYAADTWRFVRSLYDYARLRMAGTAGINVDMYLKSDEIAGYKVSLRRHSARESDTVRNRGDLRKERIFPVPKSVDPTGEIFMEAHFRGGGRGRVLTEDVLPG